MSDCNYSYKIYNSEYNSYIYVMSTEPLEIDELKAYVNHGLKKVGPNLFSIKLLFSNDEFVDVYYDYKESIPFERIRRITGYLVGTLDRFNDAKRSEEKDRVKHTV